MTLTQQQRLDQLAAALLLGGSVLGTLINYFTKQGFWSPRLQHTGLIILLVIQPLLLVQLYYISKGKRWAKILYVVLTSLGLVGVAFSFNRIAAKNLTSPVATFNFVFQYLLSLLGAVMLLLTLRKPTPEVETEAEEMY